MIEPYCGLAPLPAELIARWNLDPALIAALVVGSSAHLGMVTRSSQATGRKACVAPLLGWALLAVLFVSPLCALTSALFSARVTHHVVLVAVAAPLLALPWRRSKLAHLLARRAAAVFILHTVLLWLWHAPAPYAAALADPVVFWVMELSLLGSAMALWLVILSPVAPIGRTLGLLLGSVVQMGMLGAVITFARTPLYDAHLGVTTAWGLSALQDQQLAGLIMWVPASLPYLAVALVLLARRLDRPMIAHEPAR
ncbi:cytochrome c oxidase assembly protein [Rhodopseudomonas sp. BR0G17]|uniref:cytochrome c oxidase assembly protein n=1 Tax=Rhodopseudomonas sp. BR0G17 TaxID=2269368 RepID=UPI0013DF72CB|nr:cytochrome c oxidase assembly protein [Rhodopseudomonas sp. BR0G17]NEW99075.1 cytochrome c oxidase assembly protein [Rhodopseudomonas sp. BR0G17]